MTANHPTSSFVRMIMGVGFGASSSIRRIVSHRLQSADSGRSRDHDRTEGLTLSSHSLTSASNEHVGPYATTKRFESVAFKRPDPALRS
jgi:hypothetical protein